MCKAQTLANFDNLKGIALSHQKRIELHPPYTRGLCKPDRAWILQELAEAPECALCPPGLQASWRQLTSSSSKPHQHDHDVLIHCVGSGRATVAKLQVGLLGSARSLQRDLERIAGRADTNTPDGLHYVLQGTGCCMAPPWLLLLILVSMHVVSEARASLIVLSIVLSMHNLCKCLLHMFMSWLHPSGALQVPTSESVGSSTFKMAYT